MCWWNDGYPIPKAELEPVAQDDEIEFLLKTAGQYLTKQPQRDDILSVFTGIRPLVGQGGTKGTAQLSRDHSILVSESGLITITGASGRRRAHGEDCVNRAIQVAGLPSRETQTIDMALHGSTAKTPTRNEYGTDADLVDQLAASNDELARPIVEGYPMRGAEVVWAVRHEMARGVEDVLARRQRLLFLNATAAVRAAPRVAKLMASELGRDTRWEEEQIASFRQLAAAYQVRNAVGN